MVQLQTTFGHLSKPVTPGIYIQGRSTPSMLPGVYYYTLEKQPDGKFKQNQVRSIEDIVDTVFNIDAEVVLPREIVRRKLFGTKPTVPIREAELIRNVVTTTINNATEHYRGPRLSLEDCINEYLDPSYQCDVAIYETMRDIFRDLIYDLGSFVKLQPWALYGVHSAGVDLMVEQGEDFRIDYFNQKMREGEWR